jgi:hypothetical protein
MKLVNNFFDVECVTIIFIYIQLKKIIIDRIEFICIIDLISIRIIFIKLKIRKAFFIQIFCASMIFKRGEYKNNYNKNF